MSDETSHRLYRRTAWILAAIWLAVALIAVLLIKTPAAYAGFLIVTILCLLMVLTGSGASPRVVGFGILMLAAVIAIVAEFAGPDWPMDGAALATLAVTAGAFGVGQVFWSRRHGAPEPWIENWAGWVALAGLLGFAVAAALVRLDYVTSPTALVGVEAIAALAELAGKRWMVRLSLAAIVAAVALLSKSPPRVAGTGIGVAAGCPGLDVCAAALVCGRATQHLAAILPEEPPRMVGHMDGVRLRSPRCMDKPRPLDADRPVQELAGRPAELFSRHPQHIVVCRVPSRRLCRWAAAYGRAPA